MYNTILKSTGSYGNYVIHTSPTTSKYFWKKKEAEAWLQSETKKVSQQIEKFFTPDVEFTRDTKFKTYLLKAKTPFEIR